jgi:hypothetical protein
MKHRVMSMTTDRVHMVTRQAVSLDQRNKVEDETGMTEICVTLNKSSVKKGTMTTIVPITTNLTDGVLLKGGAMQDNSRLFLMT